MFFTSNIRLLRKRRGRTQDDVSHALGIKRPTLSGYENKVAEPGLETLIAFSRYFNVAIDTLVKVDLRELSESQLSQLERGYDVYIKGSKMRVLVTTVDKDDNENIELVSEKAKAGYKRGFADPEYIKELPAFRLPFLSSGRKYRTFQVSGESMLPVPDGAWITGEFVQDWHTIKTGKAYIIFTMDEGVMFKIVVNHLASEKKLTLVSLNHAYEPYDVTVDEIKEVWKFVHYISNEMPEAIIPGSELFKTVANLKQDVEIMKKKIK